MTKKDENIVDASELIQDDHNFNKGTDAGNKLLRDSLEKYGAGRSMLIDKDNRIIAGNKTQAQAAELGMKVKIVETDANTIVAVKRTDVSLDSKEGREMALLDNLTTQVNLTWDETELQAVQADVQGFDIADFGIDLGLPTGDPDEADKVTEDDFDPDEHYEPTSKAGDIFQLGDHRLMCGDSTKAEDVARLMNGEQADLWLTDPPYNVAYEGGTGLTIQNDKQSDADFDAFLLNAFSAARDVMKSGAAYYTWTAQGHIQTQFMKAIDEVGMPFRQQLIWVKTSLVLGHMDYQWRHEPCLYGWKEGAHYFVNSRNRTTVYEDGEEIDIDKLKKDEMKKLLHDILDSKTPESVIRCPKPQKSAYHPTMKPVRLFGYQIANSSRPGNIILDTFGGSGTTIVACEQLGRKARLMELDPHYSDVIIARWEKLTGQKAQKLNP